MNGSLRPKRLKAEPGGLPILYLLSLAKRGWWSAPLWPSANLSPWRSHSCTAPLPCIHQRSRADLVSVWGLRIISVHFCPPGSFELATKLDRPRRKDSWREKVLEHHGERKAQLFQPSPAQVSPTAEDRHTGSDHRQDQQDGCSAEPSLDCMAVKKEKGPFQSFCLG